METIIRTRNDQSYIEVDGPLFGEGEGKFWIATSSLGEYCKRGQTTSLAQFYRLVMPGLILTRHIFEGLSRPLYCDGQMSGDASKFVFTRKPAWDFFWVGGGNGHIVQKRAPEGAVFVVILSINKNHLTEYPEVNGWIERWNWVDEDSGLEEAPEGWVDRYSDLIWSRS